MLAWLLVNWTEFDVMASTATKTVFIMLLLFPCVVAAFVHLQTLKKPPFLSTDWTLGILAGCISVLGFELYFVMSRMLF